MSRGGSLNWPPPAIAHAAASILRMTLRAALAAAVDAGELRRNVAACVPMPRDVAKPPRKKDVDALDDEQLDRFLITEVTTDGAVRCGTKLSTGCDGASSLPCNGATSTRSVVSYPSTRGSSKPTASSCPTDGKNARSRRRIPIDDETQNLLGAHRDRQHDERVRARGLWRVTSHTCSVSTVGYYSTHPGRRSPYDRRARHTPRNRSRRPPRRRARPAGTRRRAASVRDPPLPRRSKRNA